MEMVDKPNQSEEPPAEYYEAEYWDHVKDITLEPEPDFRGEYIEENNLQE